MQIWRPRSIFTRRGYCENDDDDGDDNSNDAAAQRAEQVSESEVSKITQNKHNANDCRSEA